MARLITVRLHGINQIQQFVRGAVAAKKEIGDALEDSSRDIAALARQLVRVGKTGRLKRSIRVKEVAPMIWQIVAGNRKAFYAHFIERGTRRSRAYPFLRPAFEAYRKKIKERVGRAAMAGFKTAKRKRGS